MSGGRKAKADKDQTIGILGGMGPGATADLFQKIIEETPAKSDQQHIPVVIVSDPRIPDRTEAILRGGPDPVPLMLKSASTCVRAGADFLIMPCNTAHYFHQEIQNGLSIPLLHMMEEVADHLRRAYPEIRRLGLLATTGTVQSGLYQDAFSAANLAVELPEAHDQEAVMEGIYGAEGVKSGGYEMPNRVFRQVSESLIERGAEAIIAGCTEIPLALHPEDVGGAVLIDPTRILAQAAVRKARGDRPEGA